MPPTMSPAEVDLATVDLMDPDWFRDGPPHELFARMRAEAGNSRLAQGAKLN